MSFRDAYRKRYKNNAPNIVKSIEEFAKACTNLEGKLVAGFCQLAESSLLEKTWLYSQGGVCYALVTRWFRGKFANENDQDFLKWLLSGTPDMDVAEPKNFSAFALRDKQMDKWMQQQRFVAVRVGVEIDLRQKEKLKIETQRSKLAELLKQSNDIQKGVETDNPEKYQLNMRSSPLLSVPETSFKCITLEKDLEEQDLWREDLKLQLSKRKILKRSKATQYFDQSSRSKVFLAKLSQRDGKITEGALNEIVSLFKLVIDECSAYVGTTELFIYLGKKSNDGSHVMGIHHRQAGSFTSQTSVTDFFDPHYGIFRWEQEGRGERVLNVGAFLATLFKIAYRDSTTIQFAVLAKS